MFCNNSRGERRAVSGTVMRIAFVSLLCPLALSGSTYAQLTLSPRLEATPEPGNVLIVADYEQLRRYHPMVFAAAPDGVPVTEVELVAQIDFATQGLVWSLSERRSTDPQAFRRLAASPDAVLDRGVASTELVGLEGQRYALPAGEDGIMVAWPSDRQRIVRWLEAEERSPLSVFLNDAAGRADVRSVVFFALDTNRAFNIEFMQDVLRASEPLEFNPALVQRMAELLTSIQGLRVEVEGTDELSAVIDIEFAGSPAALEIIAKRLFDTGLANYGLAIPDWDQWAWRVRGNTMRFNGPVAPETVSALLQAFHAIPGSSVTGRPAMASSRFTSLSEPFNAGGRKPLPSDPTAVSMFDRQEDTYAVDPVVEATRRYFAEVNSVIQELERHSAGSSGARAKFNDKMATRIDELSMVDVDEECLAFGSDVAKRLRGSTEVFRKTNIRAGAAKTAAAASGASTDNLAIRFRTGYSPGWNGFGPGIYGYGLPVNAYGYRDWDDYHYRDWDDYGYRYRNLGYRHGNWGYRYGWGNRGLWNGFRRYGGPGLYYREVDVRNYYDTRRKLAYDRNIDKQATAIGYNNYHTVLREIKDDASDTRRYLVQKYGVDF